MKKHLIGVWFCFLAFFSYAQTRNDITVFIPTPTGGTTEQQKYFKENFEMELVGANYALAEHEKQADYILNLEIKDNVIIYEDGTAGPPEPYDPQYVVAIRLVRTEDNAEIVYFDAPFSTFEEMAQKNLPLVYQAMANVPLTKLGAILDNDHWRNKWLYIRGSFDYPITFYALQSTGLMGGSAIYKPVGQEYQKLQHEIVPWPAAMIGLELQFLNWMSIEGGFQLTFGDPFGSAFIPIALLEWKFPIKPSKHFMLEPYASAQFLTNTGSNIVQFPMFAAGGGFQFGVKGGDMGAFFADVNFFYAIGDVITRNTDTDYTLPAQIHWQRFTLCVAIGYKIGFFNRNKDQ